MRDMEVQDIIRCFPVCTLFYRMGQEVIKSRLEAVFCHTIGSDFNYFHLILDMSGSILLSSSVIDILLFGSSSACNLDLRIAAPLHVGEPLVAFLVTIGFSMLDVRAIGTPHNVLNLYHHHFLQHWNCVITVICSDLTSVMPIILAHRTSFDSIFITTSGLFIAYPEFIDQHMAYGPPIDPSINLNHGFINRGTRRMSSTQVNMAMQRGRSHDRMGWWSSTLFNH
ncbi:hypothetical protein F4604DRAFT_1926043 [Suillus subluteus]|nr:hypothetical protein F4604DRAFT_1926043 [Suillus subluteus]